MTQARVSQVAVEALVLPNPAARVSQIAVEVLVVPPNPGARVSQVAVEVLIRRSTAEDCAQAWTFPAINPYPVPDSGGPQYIFFNEVAPDWGEFGREFPDGTPAHNTMQTASVRRFVFRYAGLSQADAAILDAHYESTRGAISFTLVHPRTDEVITGVRYEAYSRGEHKRIWSQSRDVRLVKFTN
ncbi:MAG: hypothetical protein ACO24O_06675 [Arenimonas sp.]